MSPNHQSCKIYINGNKFAIFNSCKIPANSEPAYYSQILDAMVASNPKNVEGHCDGEVDQTMIKNVKL